MEVVEHEEDVERCWFWLRYFYLVEKSVLRSPLFINPSEDRTALSPTAAKD